MSAAAAPVHIVAIGSSLRGASTNQGLLRYAASVAAKHGATIEVLDLHVRTAGGFAIDF